MIACFSAMEDKPVFVATGVCDSIKLTEHNASGRRRCGFFLPKTNFVQCASEVNDR